MLHFAKMASLNGKFAIVLAVTNDPADGPRCEADTVIGHRWMGGRCFKPFDWEAALPDIKTAAKGLVWQVFEQQVNATTGNAPPRVEQIFTRKAARAWRYLTGHPRAVRDEPILSASIVTGSSLTVEQIAMMTLIREDVIDFHSAVFERHRIEVERAIDAAIDYPEVLAIIRVERDDADSTITALMTEVATYAATVAPAKVREALQDERHDNSALLIRLGL